MSFMDLARAAQKHPANDRIALADSLLHSVDEDPEYELLMVEEIERRLREIDEGKVELISGEQVFAELRAKLASMQHTAEIREDTQAFRPFEEIKDDAFQLADDERLDLAYAILRDLEEEGFKIDWETPKVIGTSTEARTANNEVP